MATPGGVHLLGIVGSVAASGRTRELVERVLAAATAALDGSEHHMLDLGAAPVDWCDGRPLEAYGPATHAAVAQVRAADGLVVGTPVYRASYTGALKNLFDLLPDEALAGTPAALTATGGSDRHFLAVDGQLRYLMAAVRVPCAAQVVYAHAGHFREGRLCDEGILADVATCAAELAGAVARRPAP